jgi:hypothetical protein
MMLVTAPDEQESATFHEFERRRLLEEVRIRLLAIANSLPDLRIDAAELQSDAEELAAVARRVQWIAEGATLGRRTPSSHSLNPPNPREDVYRAQYVYEISLL